MVFPRCSRLSQKFCFAFGFQCRLVPNFSTSIHLCLGVIPGPKQPPHFFCQQSKNFFLYLLESIHMIPSSRKISAPCLPHLHIPAMLMVISMKVTTASAQVAWDSTRATMFLSTALDIQIFAAYLCKIQPTYHYERKRS